MTRESVKETSETVYQFICDYIQLQGYAPTLREIAAACYLGRSTVIRHLDKLEAAGRITREGGQARSITITHEE